MKHLPFACLVLSLSAPGTVLAATAFDGTWKQDAATASFSGKPEILSLQNGIYHCETCVPAITVKADGAFQPVTGHPAMDMIAVQAVDAKTIHQTEKKAGRVVSEVTMVLGPDGKTATVHWSDMGDGAPVTGTTNLARTKSAPAGAHALSGSWKIASLSSMSDSGSLMTFRVDGGAVHFSTPAGLSYVAKLDGTQAPFAGDPRVTAVSVRMPQGRQMVESDKRDGKLIETVTMTVAPDGKTMSILFNNKISGRTAHFTASKI